MIGWNADWADQTDFRRFGKEMEKRWKTEVNCMDAWMHEGKD
jgi:hypothetical protein